MIKDIRDALADFLSILRKDSAKSNKSIVDVVDKNTTQTTKAINTQKDSVLKQLGSIEKAIKEQEVAESVSITNPEAITGDLKKGLEGIIETLKKEVKNFDKTVVVKNDLGHLASAFKGSREKKDLLKGLKSVEKAIKSISYPEIPDNSRELLDIADKIGNKDVVEALGRLLEKEFSFPDIMAVDLDPRLIDDNRLRTVLPDDQVAKMSAALSEGRSGGAIELKQDDIIANQISQMMTRVATNSGDSSICYTGMAKIDSETSEAVWKITKYDESVDEIAKFADDGNFTQIWDNRESLTYT